PAPPRVDGLPQHRAGQDRALCTGRGDHHVGPGKRVGEPLERNRLSAQAAGELGGPLPGPVADEQVRGDLFGQEKTGGPLSCLAGADDQGCAAPAAAGAAEDLLRELDSGPTDRDGAAGDLGLGAYALAGLNGTAKETLEDPAGGAGVLGEAQRVLYLTEDL